MRHQAAVFIKSLKRGNEQTVVLLKFPLLMANPRSGKKSKFGVIALCGVAILGGLYFAWKSQQTPVGGQVFAKLPATEQQKRREDLKKLEGELGDVAEKAKRHEKAPFSVTFTEENINTFLQDRLRTEKFPIHDPRAGLSPGQLTLEGKADYKGFSAPARLSGNLSVKNGQVTFQADSLTVQGFPVDSLKDKAESEVNKLLARGLVEADINIESVTIEQGQMTITGQTK